MSDTLHQITPQSWPKAVPPSQRPFSEIGGNRLLAALPAADFELLAPHLREAKFEPGAMLQQCGQPLAHAYFLESGLVSLLAVAGDHALHSAFVGREGAVGLTAGLVAHKASTHAVVHVTVSAARIPVARLAEAAIRSRAVRDMIARCSDALLEQAHKVVACNTLHNVNQRVCGWLFEAHRRTGKDMLSLTQACLADMLGVQRTTVTAVARALQAQGIIKVRRGKIQILQVGALEGKACGCTRSGRSRDV
jgi:CRP-like cAMP-binding protein